MVDRIIKKIVGHKRLKEDQLVISIFSSNFLLSSFDSGIFSAGKGQVFLGLNITLFIGDIIVELKNKIES